MGRFQQRKLLSHSQRSVIGQHHATRAEPNRVSHRGKVRDQHGRGRRRHRWHVVVLGDPEPGETESICGLGHRYRRGKRVAGRLVSSNGHEIQHRKSHP